MRKDWGNVLALPTWELEAGYYGEICVGKFVLGRCMCAARRAENGLVERLVAKLEFVDLIFFLFLTKYYFQN